MSSMRWTRSTKFATAPASAWVRRNSARAADSSSVCRSRSKSSPHGIQGCAKPMIAASLWLREAIGLIHHTPANHGLQYLDVGDLLRGNLEEVAIQDDQIREFSHLERTG